MNNKELLMPLMLGAVLATSTAVGSTERPGGPVKRHKAHDRAKKRRRKTTKESRRRNRTK